MINDISAKLAEKGHEVTVITGMPNYPSGKIYGEYKNGKIKNEVINGVSIKRCLIIPRGKNHICLLLNYISFMVSSSYRLNSMDDSYDVIYVYQMTPITVLYSAIKYAKKNNKKVFCYCLDLAPASGIQLIKRLNLISNMYYRFSNWAYRNCDIIGVTSKSFIAYIHAIHGIELNKMRYIPQHAPVDLINENLAKSPNDIIEFMFAGNMGEGAKLEVIIHAGEILKNRKRYFKIYFVGEGRAKKTLTKLTEDLKLNDNIIFCDAVPMNEMKKKYRLADALLVTLRAGQITIPGKLQAYMSTGKPIFGAMDGSGKELINEVNCGKCVSAEDITGLANIMEHFIDHMEDYQQCGKNGREYFRRNFTLDEHIKQLELGLVNLK